MRWHRKSNFFENFIFNHIQDSSQMHLFDFFRIFKKIKNWWLFTTWNMNSILEIFQREFISAALDVSAKLIKAFIEQKLKLWFFSGGCWEISEGISIWFVGGISGFLLNDEVLIKTSKSYSCGNFWDSFNIILAELIRCLSELLTYKVKYFENSFTKIFSK